MRRILNVTEREKIHKNLVCINYIVSYWQTVIILQHDGLIIFPHHRSEIQRVLQDLGFDILMFWTKHSCDSEWGMYLHKDLHHVPYGTKVLGSKAVQFFPTIQK